MSEYGILFLSGLDFKEKSIQVIRKTPEAFFKSGWKVYYATVRDNSKYGDYYYEKEINPFGIKIIRKYRMLTKYRDKLYKISKIASTAISKIDSWLTIIRLAFIGYSILKKNRNIKVVYGYELQGILALLLLDKLGFLHGKIRVSRFQGTYYYYYYLKNHNLVKLILNFDNYIALKYKTDLCIMTNDGTEGDWVLKKIHSKNIINLRFWVNGVDNINISSRIKSQIRKSLLNNENSYILMTICRLVPWKRLDRAIEIMAYLKHDLLIDSFKYVIIGDGPEKNNLMMLANKLSVDKEIIFLGAINNNEISNYLSAADIYISTYDVSNVGNPLLEAIRSKKIIFTLNNGRTSDWIIHGVNGFIYDINDDLIKNIAKDIYKVFYNKKLKNEIFKNIKNTEKERLWTWEERLSKEVENITFLVNKK